MEALSVVDALYSRVAVIPGGTDLEERPIIVVDAELSARASNEYLEKALRYYSSIFSTETRKLGLCIVINSQKSTWRTGRIILDRVNEVFRNESASIIMLRPEAFWDKRRVENCAARLIKPNRIEAVYVPISRLHKYINPSHLPEELGGSWVYNHSLWIENRMKIETFTKLSGTTIINLESVRRQLSAAKDCLKCDISDDNSSSSYVSPETYQTTKEETLKTINAGHALIEQIEKQDERQHLLTTLPKDVLDTKDQITGLLRIIQDKMTLVDESWVDVRRRNERMKEVMKIEDGVSKVTNWILERGEKLLNAQQNVGYDVVSAEDLRRNHESLELQCRKPYGHYAELLRKLSILTRKGTRFPRDLKSQKEFMDFVCRSFATRVERRRNVLITSARFFRLVSEYFQITSNVYEDLIMRVDVEALESAEPTLEELQKSLTNIDALEKELVREGEKLSDLLSIPVKDALGRDLAVNYQGDIVNVREILEMTIERKQLFKDSVELQILSLRQIIHIRNYENNASQAVQWLDELYQVMLKSHSHIGCSVHEIQIQKEIHQSFQETAKETFEFGCQLLQAALVLRQSCKLSERTNNELSKQVWKSWKKLYEVSQEQLTRLRVSAVFHRNVDQYCQELKGLSENFLVSVVEEETPKKRTHLKNILSKRENILTEVGRMMRLGRMLKSRLREPLRLETKEQVIELHVNEEVNCNNEVAIDAISEKLSEVTILAEQLDTTLCRFKFDMESDTGNIKKLLETMETTETTTDVVCQELPCDSKNSSETNTKLDSNKSDEEFTTASECTGTPPSRTSSYHTASEGEPNYTCWDIDNSVSSENELDTTSETKTSPDEQQTEICSQLIQREKELRENQSILTSEPFDLTDTEPKQKCKSQYQLELSIPPNMNNIPAQRSYMKHNDENSMVPSNTRPNMSPQSFEILIHQIQNENTHSFSDRFPYQERFIKQALTGIF